jgi:hypothetical protein
MIQTSLTTLMVLAIIFTTVTLSLQGQRLDRLQNRVLELEKETFELRLTKRAV